MLVRVFSTGMTVLAVTLLLAVCQAVQAKDPPEAKLSFTAPTKRVDGSNITGALSYDVYQGLRGTAKTKIGTITATSTTITSGLLGGNEYCWHVVVREAGNPSESAPSNEACKAFDKSSPQTVVITIQ